jgi:peptidoglycan/xylan/chitin deacetylase (PgdA/CDA1 family)
MQAHGKKKLAIAAGICVVLAGGVYWTAKQVGGFRNLFSPKYWSDRTSGNDLFDAKDAIFKRGSRDHQDLLLTIDDGPHPESLPRILDTLKKYHVHATFFMVGKMVKLHPELVRRAINEGNEVGNHTQDHLRLDTLTEKQIRTELENCNTNIERACGRGTKLMRPPGMRFNPTVLKVLHEMGYTCVDWNIAAKDFVPPVDKKDAGQSERIAANLDPKLIAQRVVDNAKNGEIILLHDIAGTADALPTILEELQAKGFTFKTTSEMLAELPKPVLLVANPPAPAMTLTAVKDSHSTNPLKPKSSGPAH